MSDPRARKEDGPKAARGATLFSGKKTDKKKKREWKVRSDNRKPLINEIYNKADDPQHERHLIKYLASNGIEVGSYKDRYILRRLRVRMGRLKFSSYKDYLEYIRKHPKELIEIQESLSINVTRFFRNRDSYEMVKQDILPQLVRDHTSIKIWSAGCAVGAEPYSIAMIVSDVVPQNVKATVMATDIKEELLKTARFGIYSEPYLAEMKASEISKYFIETSSGDYKIKPHIKSLVNFRQQDLMKDDFPRNIDMIFCRNVLIYVDRQAQNIILNKFFEALKPGGFLVLGRTETLFGDWRKSVNIISTKHRIYQKKKTGNFDGISLNNPVADLMGANFPQVKKIERRKEPRKLSKSSASERLQELKDFRRTFEERKKLWEERMEQNRKNREARRTQITRSSSTSSFSSERRRSITRDWKKNLESNKDDDNGSDSLLDYRKKLKRAKEPIRESRIRRDIEDK